MRFLSLLLSLLSLASCGTSSEEMAPGAVAPEGADPALTELMAAARIPGLSLAEIRGGEIVRVERAGVESIESGRPVTEETLFEAASLSKPVFATVVLRLAERGELDLDQPLDEIVADERIDHDPRARAITARLVLAHRTGLPNWGGDELELAFAPGEGFNYSGEGYVYLQHAVEKLTGMSLDELARREVFEPLGMERSRYSWPESADGELDLAAPHDLAGRLQSKYMAHEDNAAASLHTTAEEYARFVLSWMGRGEPLLSPETRAMALAPAVRMRGDETARPKPEAVWRRIAWGLGWGLQLRAPDGPEGGSGSQAPRGTLVWHWGDNGPFKAFVAFDPVAGDGIVYFANSSNGLAIGRAMVAPVVGSMDAAFTWAGYEAYDAPGFAERLDGFVASADHRWDDAIAAFEAAVAAAPGDEVTQRRIEWLRELESAETDPFPVSRDTLERYAGSYGPRRLWLEDGALHYQRGRGDEHVLIPLEERLFALDDLPDFRLEVSLDEAGEPVALIGRYVEGETDETPRDGTVGEIG